MSISRTITTAVVTAAAGVAVALGTAGVAAAAPSTTATQAASSTVDATFNLLSPNSPVVFTVDGATVATGTTNSVGDVSVSIGTDGFAPGAYRLVATAATGISSSVGFVVQ